MSLAEQQANQHGILAARMIDGAGMSKVDGRRLIGSSVLGLKRWHQWDWCAEGMAHGSLEPPMAYLPMVVAYALVHWHEHGDVIAAANHGLSEAAKLAYKDSGVHRVHGRVKATEPMHSQGGSWSRGRGAWSSGQRLGYEEVEEYSQLGWAIARIGAKYDEQMAEAFYLWYHGYKFFEIGPIVGAPQSTVRHWLRELIPNLFDRKAEF